MNKEQINRKLAEWMGWKRYSCFNGCLSPTGEWFDRTEPYETSIAKRIPNYHSSLDAVAEVTWRLSDVPFLNKDKQEWSERCEFMCALERIVIRDSKIDRCNFEFYNATAPQRCEALLKTLGLWGEDV